MSLHSFSGAQGVIMSLILEQKENPIKREKLLNIQSNLGQKEKHKPVSLPCPVRTSPSSPARRRQTKDLLSVGIYQTGTARPARGFQRRMKRGSGPQRGSRHRGGRGSVNTDGRAHYCRRHTGQGADGSGSDVDRADGSGRDLTGQTEVGVTQRGGRA